MHHEPDSNRFLVTRHEDIKHVLSHPEIFSNVRSRSGLLGDQASQSGIPERSLLLLDDPDHKQARDVAFVPFKPGRIRRFEPMIRAEANAVIDEFIDDGQVDFSNDFAAPFVAFVTCNFLGFPTRELRDTYRRAAAANEASALVYLPEERRLRDFENWVEMKAFVDDAIAERRANPGDDGLSDMIRFQIERDGAFDADYLREQAVSVFLGGLLTTVHLIANSMISLLDEPEQMAMVRADRSLIPQMVEESLRKESPTQWNPRRVAQDTVLGGVEIPAGSFVILLYGSANREETKFECPEQMRVDRPNAKEHLAFGYGGHFCIGAPLARTETRIAFETLFDRLSEIRFAEPEAEIQYQPSASFRAPIAVPIAFDPAI